MNKTEAQSKAIKKQVKYHPFTLDKGLYKIGQTLSFGSHYGGPGAWTVTKIGKKRLKLER